MAEGQFIPVARIVKSHGLKGEVSVMATDDLPFVLVPGLHVWFVPPPSVGPRDAVVSSVRQGPKGPLVTFTGIEHVQMASALRGHTVMARSEDLPDDLGDEVLDPVGMDVIDDVRGWIGTVSEVLETGANDVLVVEGSSLGQVLIPVIDDCIIDVDEEARQLSVHLLPGLIEGD